MPMSTPHHTIGFAKSTIQCRGSCAGGDVHRPSECLAIGHVYQGEAPLFVSVAQAMLIAFIVRLSSMNERAKVGLAPRTGSDRPSSAK